MPNITLANSAGTYDITGLAASVRWSGDYRQCARTLEVALLSSPNDSRVPVVDCPVGSLLQMSEGGTVLFTGIVTDRDKSTAANTIDLTAHDYGFYLKKNATSVKFNGITPEVATAQLCTQFDLTPGSLAPTGVAVRRKFSQRPLYDIIMTLYTAAAEVTGKAYFVVFEDGKLNVREKGAQGEMVVIKSGVNLMDAAVSESIQNMVNQVAVYDSDDKLLYTKSDAESVAQYGLMQAAVRQAKDEDATAKVQAQLKNSGPEQKITVNNLGDLRCMTGGCVMMEESYTGLYGQFYVDSDIHQWKNGVYTNKLVLNLNAVMDEKAAGTVIKAGSGDGANSSELQKIIKQSQDKTYKMPEGGKKHESG